MALLNCNFYSKSLAYDTQVNVLLPESREPFEFDESKDYCFQVLYLLHGRGDDCYGWIKGTNIERYAMKHRLAVVMPSAEDSFYLNAESGKRFFSYIAEELPQKMEKWFPISSKPEDKFIAGVSMGGYGALKIGLTYPEQYSGIGLFSAVTMPELLLGGPLNESVKDIMQSNIESVFGKDGFKKDDLPIELIRKCKREGKVIPPIWQYEGTNDLLYRMNEEFYQLAKNEEIDITYEEWEGVHDWEFWDTAVKKVLDAFSLKNQVLFL